MKQSALFEPPHPIVSPLKDWSVLQTNDIEYAYDAISATFKEHKFSIEGTNKKSDVQLHSLDLGDVSINYIQYGINVDVDPGPLKDFYLIHMPIKGHSEVIHGEHNLLLDKNSAAICSPSYSSKFRWLDDCGVLAIRIEKAAIHDYVETVYGTELKQNIIFSPQMSAGSNAFTSWSNLVRYILTEADNPASLIGQPHISKNLKHLLISCLINNQPHNQTDTFGRNVPMIAPRHVRSAEDYIRTNISGQITIAALAQCANVSERTLFEGFKNFRNVSPMRYVLNMRLQHVRKDLQRGPRNEMIGEILARWGFTHHGAFSKSYRDKYGETPTQTRHRYFQ